MGTENYRGREAAEVCPVHEDAKANPDPELHDWVLKPRKEIDIEHVQHSTAFW